MPKKIRDLISILEKSGFASRSGKGSHRVFSHPKLDKIVIISGKTGSDAKPYQEKQVKKAIEESRK